MLGLRQHLKGVLQATQTALFAEDFHHVEEARPRSTARYGQTAGMNQLPSTHTFFLGELAQVCIDGLGSKVLQGG